MNIFYQYLIHLGQDTKNTLRLMVLITIYDLLETLKRNQLIRSVGVCLIVERLFVYHKTRQKNGKGMLRTEDLDQMQIHIKLLKKL